MAFSHGSKAVAKFGTSAVPATPTDISAYLTSASAPRSADTHDVTTFGDTSKDYIPGLLDGTISIEGKFDPTVDAHLAGILALQVAFEYHPQGVVTGTPKYTGNCICTSYEPDTPVDSEATFSAEFQVTGNVGRTTNP